MAMLHQKAQWRDDRGMTLILVGVGFLAFMSATMLAVDVGMFMVARTQSQVSADSGALAGATALVMDDFNDRTDTGAAKQNAIVASTSTNNGVINQRTSVIPSDVTFPTVDQVRVVVQRSTARGNPVPTFLGAMVHIPTVDIGAVATAEAAPANAMTCVKPFMIPDRWREVQDPPWTPDSTFDAYDKKGNPIPNPDVYVPRDQSGYTGYDPYRDKGLELMIRAGTGNNIAPSTYYSWAMPGGTGGSWYRSNIANCNHTVVHPGDIIIQEPGNMVGPTDQGIDDLIAQDPNATWDTSTNKVIHSAYGTSPRVAPIPIFDPVYWASGKRNGRNADFKVANWIGFFIERRQGNNVYGRITPIIGNYDSNAGPAPIGSFAKVIRLIQ